MDKFVQFKDSAMKEIVAIFSCAQDPEQFPNQGSVPENDQRYIDFMALHPSPWPLTSY